MKFIVIASSFVMLCATVFMVGAGAHETSHAPSDSPTREQVQALFALDRNSEMKAYKAAERMSDGQLTQEVRRLYTAWQEEERWASFLQSLLLYEKSRDTGTYKVWQSTWSELTSGLWVWSNMHGFHARQILEQNKFDRMKYQDLYASLTVLLPKVGDARIRLVKGLMTDVYGAEDPGLFMGPWSFDLKSD